MRKDRTMKRHMKRQIARWLTFAKEVTTENLAIEDIVFVQGYVKTTRRAIAAFTGTDPMDVDSTISEEPEDGSDECIFVHYLKMKERPVPTEGPTDVPEVHKSQVDETSVRALLEHHAMLLMHLS